MRPAVDVALAREIIEWGLAANPNTARAELERLARSANIHTRMSVAWNPDTPPGILERLAADPDALIAENAKRALERRRRTENPGRKAG